MPAYLQRLALDKDADERAIRRAYARELKLIDQEADPAAFQALREAYEAALGWVQWQQHEVQDDDDVHRDDVLPAAAVPLTLDETSGQPAATQPAPPPHTEQAAVAYADFVRQIDAEAPQATKRTSALWSAHLERSLEQLVSIEARELFEHHVATLLADGWRPGHETLLVAAAAIFSWKEDRRRLYNLGMAGATLNRALEEHAMFSQQIEAARKEQSKLISRLRDPAAPIPGELVKHHRALEWLHANYSTWMSLITDAGAVGRWRQAYADLPGWRRKLSRDGWRKEASGGYELQTSFSWKWLWVLLFIGLVRMCTSFSSDKPKPPAAPPQQQQTAKQQMHSGDYLRQGNAQLERSEYGDAIASYNHVISMTPNNFMAYIGRGTAYLSLGNDQQAEADFNRSGAIESENHALHTARGKLADFRNQPVEAIAHYSDALDMLPQGDRQLLWLRANAYEKTGDRAHALADMDRLIGNVPDAPSLFYTYRMDLLLQLGRLAEADAVAKTTLAKFPTESDAYRVISEQYRRHGQTAKADAMLERGLKVAPDASLLLGRARLRAPDDLQGRRADLARAAKMAPESFILAQERADLEIAAGNLAAADAVVAQALKALSKDDNYWPPLLAMRGVVAGKRGEGSIAEQYFSDALKASHNAWQMNEICWLMAVRNVSLPTALFICDAALERKPDYVAAVDSRGLVLLRLGRNQDALAAYEAALAGRPNFAHSLLGRGIARQRLGDRAGGDADIKAALKAQPSLRKDYASYGISI